MKIVVKLMEFQLFGGVFHRFPLFLIPFRPLLDCQELMIHLWAGPLLSAPAEVVVGNDEVSVRPTGVSKASQLEKILQRICCEEP